MQSRHYLNPDRDSANSLDPPQGGFSWPRYVGCGFLMGGADVIPGVSGGTVALILGIYQRLVIAISRCDLTLLHLFKKMQWRAIVVHLDLPFLVPLGAGIGLGVITLGGVMNQLLSSEATRPLALAALFGMIAASAVVVARILASSPKANIGILFLVGTIGAAVAFGLTQLTAGPPNTSPWYVFLSGSIAICAMILPGISGAYLLLVLGLYDHITGILKALPRGEVVLADIVTVAIFATGCGLGLILFTKLLRWLLRHHQAITMSLLCGFMAGALPKVWPFQVDMTPTVEKLSHKHFRLGMPPTISELIGGAAVAVVAFGIVLLVDRVGNGRGESRGELH